MYMILGYWKINTISKNAYTWSQFTTSNTLWRLEISWYGSFSESFKRNKTLEAKAYGQKECFEAGVNFARTIVPAPEATHAVKGAIDAALECKKNEESKQFYSTYVVMVILI